MLKLLKKPDNRLKLFLAAILLVVPLYPKFPFIRVPGIHVSIRLEDFLLAFVGFFLLFEIFPQIKKFLKDKIVVSMIIFLLAGLVSLLSGIFLTKTVIPHIGFLHWLRRAEYFLPFFLGALILKQYKPQIVGFVVKVLMVVVFIVFLFGLGQKFLSWPVIITQNQEYAKGVALRYLPGGHLISTFAGHYDLASFLVLVLPIIITALVLLKGKKSRLILALVSLEGLWLLANSLSRISVASYLIAVSAALFLAGKRSFIPAVVLVSLLIFGFSSNLLDRYFRVFQVAKERVQKVIQIEPTEIYAQDFSLQRINTSTPTPASVPVFEDRSVSIRLNVEWPRAIRAFSKNPLLGTGYSSITLATDNDFLRLLGEVGLIGFFAFFLIFARIGQQFLRVLPLNKYFKGVELAFVAGVFGAVPGVFTNATFIDIFEASKFAIIFWLLLGIGFYMLRFAKNEKIN